MKLKSLLFAVCFGLAGYAVAANQHLHPKANEVNNNTKNSVSKASMLPGYCEIEVINDSYEDVFVDGFFDDNIHMDTFRVRRYDAAHYISLYYYGYCHSGMQLRISAPSSPYYIYDRWTSVGSTVRIVPYLANGITKSENDKNVKVEVTAK